MVNRGRRWRSRIDNMARLCAAEEPASWLRFPPVQFSEVSFCVQENEQVYLCPNFLPRPKHRHQRQTKR